MKYSLRSLLIVVTLVAVVLARVSYLKRWADFHQRESHRRLFDPEGDLLNRDVHVEYCLQAAYEKAMWRPWTIVDEEKVVADFWDNYYSPFREFSARD